MTTRIVAAILACLAVSSLGFSQGANVQLSGVTTDQSKALVPGVTITLVNTETSVTTSTITNESGVYIFPAVQPGTAYRASASLPGFQTSTVTNLNLTGDTAFRQNFELRVAGVGNQTVEVISEANAAITGAGASVGDVLTRERVTSLPLIGDNVLDLLAILPGFRDNAFGSAFARIGGLGIDTVNVTRDGISVTDPRFQAGQDSVFQTTSNGGLVLCPGGGFAVGLAVDPDRPCSTSYTGGSRILSATTINPDLVGEIRLILSPVDAELGRGNSQIQIQTRSGTNRYTGSATWNIENTALNANTWGNNNDIDPLTGRWSPTVPTWRNSHRYTVSYGGPIIRNKTFFFASWNQQISNTRETIENRVLTDSARQGIFRFWEGYVPDSADPANVPSLPSTSTNPTMQSVDFGGKPLRPQFWADNTPYTGSLVCFSVFGNLKMDGSPFTAADCPGGTDSRGMAYTGRAVFPTSGGVWDPFRPVSNPNGYITRVIEQMPKANDFFDDGNGDGLNYATFRYLRGRNGNSTNQSIVGSESYTNRKQINLKIDQNFSESHKASGSWTYQWDDSTDNVATWPNGFSGTSTRRPQTFAFNVTSTLSSALLNEGRFGFNINKTASSPAWFVNNAEYAAQAREWLAPGGTRNGNPYFVTVNENVGDFSFSSGILQDTSGTVTNLLYNNPAFTFADTVNWTRGRHSFRFGGDVRITRSSGSSLQAYPVAAYGNGGGGATSSPLGSTNGNVDQIFTNIGCPTTGTNGCTRATFTTTTRDRARDLEYLLTDSVGTIQNFWWIESQKDVVDGFWQDTTTRENRLRETIGAEYAFFTQDNYKLTGDLTVNLGLRYEYYSPPYIKSGLTSTILDQGDGVFGASRAAGIPMFGNWLRPGNLYLAGYGSNPAGGALRCESGVPLPGGGGVSTCDPKALTQIEFVGPNTDQPGKTVIPRDRNNFGPVLGFSWQVPWFGAGKTTIRGGYQMTFAPTRVSEGQLAAALGGFSQPILSSTNPAVTAITQGATPRALLVSDLPTLIPANTPPAAPGQIIPIYARSASTQAYDPNYATPYTQNLTLSVTRSLSRLMTLDVRYTGTLAKKQSGTLDVNTNNVMYNAELFDALERTRRGENVPLFDQMLAGLRLPNVPTAYGAVNGTTSRGSEQLRLSSSTRANLANGNLVAVANTLVTGTTGTTSTAAAGAGSAGTLLGGAGQQPAPTGLPFGRSQVLLRNGCDRLANGVTTAGGVTVPTRCFPENYLIANPQLSGATYYGNYAYNNYHGLQLQFQLRPVQGISFQSTYTTAKSLGLPGSGYADPLQRAESYGAGGGTSFRSEPTHNFRTNGTFELPIGPNKLLFGSTSGWVARLIERWSTSVILNVNSGSKSTLSGAQAMRYASGRYVATQHWRTPKGEVEWSGNSGTFFGRDTFVTLRDPQCFDAGAIQQVSDLAGQNSLGAACTLNALGILVPAGTPGSFQISPTDTRTAVYALVNPKPGQFGTLGGGTIESWGVYYLDANLSKTFRLTESKQMSVRIDATNVLNHPQVDVPNLAVGGTLLGNIPGKNTRAPRNLQAQLRFTF